MEYNGELVERQNVMKDYNNKKLNLKSCVIIVLMVFFSGAMTSYASGKLFTDDIGFYYQKNFKNGYGDTYYYSKDGSKKIGHLPKLDGYKIECDKENYCYVNKDGYINMSYNGTSTNDIGNKSTTKYKSIDYFKDGVLVVTTETNAEHYYYEGKLIYDAKDRGFDEAIYITGDGLVPDKKLINKDNIFYMEYNEDDEYSAYVYKINLDGSKTFVTKDVIDISILPNDLYKYYIKNRDGNLLVYDINTKSLNMIDENVEDYLLFGDNTYYVVKSKTVLVDFTKLINVDSVEGIKMPSLFVEVYKSDNYKTDYEAYERDIKNINRKKEKNRDNYQHYINRILSYPDGYELKLYDIYYFDGENHNLIAKDAVYAELKKEYTHDKNIVVEFTKWDENVRIDINALAYSEEENDINNILYIYFNDVSHYIVNKDKASLLNVKSGDNSYIEYSENGNIYCFVSDENYNKEHEIKKVVINDKNDALVENISTCLYIAAKYKNYVLVRKDKKFHLYDLINNKLIYEYNAEELSIPKMHLYKNGFIFVIAKDKYSRLYQIKYIDIVNNNEEIIADDISEYMFEEIVYDDVVDKQCETIASSIIMNKKYTLLYDDFIGNANIKNCIDRLKEKNLYMINSSTMYDGKIRLSEKLRELAKYYGVSLDKYTYHDDKNNINDISDKKAKVKKSEDKQHFEIQKVEELDFRFTLDLNSKANITLFMYYPVIKDNIGNFSTQVNYLNETLKEQRPVFVEHIEKTLDYQSKDGLCCFKDFELEYDGDLTLNIYFNGYLQFGEESEKYDMKYVMKYNLKEGNYQFVDLN